MTPRYQITEYEDGRSSIRSDLLETQAATPRGFLRAFYRQNRNAPRGAFVAEGPDADGAWVIFSRASLTVVERYRPHP